MDKSLQRAKQIRHWLKIEWVELWKNKHDDEITAEDISVKEYSLLEVDRGEVIHATRDYKPLSFREIYEKHVGSETASKVIVNPKIGGWGKFAKKHFSKKNIRNPKREPPSIKFDVNQHQRKNGMGWLNNARIRRMSKENNVH